MQFLTVQKTLQKSFSSIFYIPGCNNHPKAEIKVLGYDVNQGSIQNGTDLYQNVIDSTVNNSSEHCVHAFYVLVIARIDCSVTKIALVMATQ